MKVYLVRHGETEGNASNRYQTPHTPLSTIGLFQADHIANRFKTIHIDAILSSTMKRAKQTAEKISKEKNLKIEYKDILRERKTPSDIQGERKDNPKVKKVERLQLESENKPDWHYSDEENAHDLIKRSRQIITMLEMRKEKELLVVSHGEMIRFIVLTMMFQETMKPERWRTHREFFTVSNTGVTLCEREKNRWKMITWNDHAHLG